MSDEPVESREWLFYIEDMLRFAEKALAYTEGLGQAAFVADERTYDATLRNIELIGEAATHVPAEVQEAYPRIPWRAIVGARNLLGGVHDHRRAGGEHRDRVAGGGGGEPGAVHRRPHARGASRRSRSSSSPVHPAGTTWTAPWRMGTVRDVPPRSGSGPHTVLTAAFGVMAPLQPVKA